MTLQDISVRLTEYLLKDKDFRQLYNKSQRSDLTFEAAVGECVEMVCNEDNFEHYLLDKKYLDISWLEIETGVVINMDDVWEYFKEIINE